MNIAMVTDFLLLAASGVACFYCWILSKRLKGLTSAEKGLGAGIQQLSVSAEEVKAAVATAKSGADAAAARLEQLLVRADQKTAELTALYGEIDRASEQVAAKTEGATRKYVDTLSPFLTEANEIADRLFFAIERAPRGAPSPAPAQQASGAPGDEQEPAYLYDAEQPPRRAAGR